MARGAESTGTARSREARRGLHQTSKGDLRVHYRLALRNCLSSRLIALGLALVLLAVARPAQADARTEAAAKALEAKAMQEDYLATEFDKALEKLNQAASKCGERCS